MEIFFEFFTNFIYVFCFISFGQLFFDFERKYSKYEKILLVILVLFTTIVLNYSEIWLKAIVHASCVLIILFLYFKESGKTVICFYVWITAALYMLTTIFVMLVSEITGYLKITFAENLISLIAQSVTLLYIWGIGKYFKEKYSSGLKKIGTKYIFFLAIVLLFDAVIVVLLEEYVINTMQIERRGLLVFVYISVVIGILIQLVLLINALITRNVHKENETLAKQFLDNQKEHYLYLEKREIETKKFRHDIKNHLLLLRNLINNKDYNEVEKYLNTLNEKVSNFSNHISVNNDIADAIFNKFYFEAQEKDITIRVNGHFPLECYISAYDICTVLSNLLSNAILAESQYGGNSISVDIRYTIDEIFLSIENDFNHQLQVEDGMFKTTKIDSLGHGFGLSNVMECVEKCGGHISITTDNQHFKVMLSMKNEKEEMA